MVCRVNDDITDGGETGGKCTMTYLVMRNKEDGHDGRIGR